MLIRLFAVQDTYKLHDLYLLLKKELKSEDFQQEENPVLQVIKKRKLSVYFDILLGKEQNYFRAVGILKEIRQNMKANGWNEEWERKYDSFINQHRRKKLLMKQLEGFSDNYLLMAAEDFLPLAFYHGRLECQSVENQRASTPLGAPPTCTHSPTLTPTNKAPRMVANKDISVIVPCFIANVNAAN